MIPPTESILAIANNLRDRFGYQYTFNRDEQSVIFTDLDVQISYDTGLKQYVLKPTGMMKWFKTYNEPLPALNYLITRDYERGRII